MKLAACFALLTVLAVGASIADPAFAARPVRGGHFVGFDGRLRDFNFAHVPDRDHPSDFREVSAELRVSRTGRRLSRRGGGSYVTFSATCARERSGFVEGVTIKLAPARRRGPRIGNDGSFRVLKRAGRLRYSLRGRFVSSSAAKLVYRASVPPERPKNPSHPGRCGIRGNRVALRKDGQPPFLSCADEPTATLIWGPAGRVFMQYQLTGQGFFPFVYGCSFEANRRFALGQDYDDADVRLPQLAGPYTAWVTGFTILVMDLRTGARTLRVHPEELSSIPFAPLIYADDLALKENGSVAWISVGSAGIEVWAYDTFGRRRLDSGPGIKLGSLTLAGSTLTWVKDGVTRTATLS